MTRGRVESRAQSIFEFLRTNLNTPYRIDELLESVGFSNGATTRSAIRRARELATDAGLCFPVACPANGHTYCVTDDPSAVVDPSLHLAGIAAGVGVRLDEHQDFIESRTNALSPSERLVIEALGQQREVDRAQREADRSLVKALTAMRRELRTAVGGGPDDD